VAKHGFLPLLRKEGPSDLGTLKSKMTKGDSLARASLAALLQRGDGNSAKVITHGSGMGKLTMAREYSIPWYADRDQGGSSRDMFALNDIFSDHFATESNGPRRPKSINLGIGAQSALGGDHVWLLSTLLCP